MKFLQLLCIVLLLSAALAAPLNAPNATEADASLKSAVEKLAKLKSEVQKIKSDGNFKDRSYMDLTELYDKIYKEILNRHQ